jgi:hypothetical protein
MSFTQTTKCPFKSQNLKTYLQCFRLRHLSRPFFWWFGRCNSWVLTSSFQWVYTVVTNPRQKQLFKKYFNVKRKPSLHKLNKESTTFWHKLTDAPSNLWNARPALVSIADLLVHEPWVERTDHKSMDQWWHDYTMRWIVSRQTIDCAKAILPSIDKI